MKITDHEVIARLLHHLELPHNNAVRLEAARKLGEIKHASPAIIAALERHANAIWYEFSQVCRASLDSIRVATQLRKLQPRPKILHASVKITAEESPGLTVADAKTWRKCNFCDKEVAVNPANIRYADRLSGPDKFFCNFCLRNRLNQKDSRHTLLLSFRGIIGYYYYSFYHFTKPLMYITEIMDYIELHRQAGMQNPLFLYDHDSFMWFIDFTRVGQGRNKLPVEEILKTVTEILLTFSLQECVKDIRPYKLYAKYEEAIFKFYHQRSRPANMRVLSPTLKMTGAGEYAPEKLARESYNSFVTANEKRRIPIDDTRNFTPDVLREALGKKV
jgi:hypothetical protein